MSTLPPNRHDHRDDLMRASQVNMAVAQPTKTKSASKATHNASAKAKSQMHRRSRTGCYTCRLRRKKCDEGSPTCSACKHLGLCCEYKRPMWWSNNDMRRQHKDDIKVIIKRRKLSEKASHSHSRSIQTSMPSLPSLPSPPSLSHSLPTSATFSDPLDRTRSQSIDSQYSFHFTSPPVVPEGYPYTSQMPPEFMFGAISPYTPYDIDVKTERQMFVDDVPTLHESTTSTFSTYTNPPPAGTMLSASFPLEGGEWTEQIHTERRESLPEDTLNCHFDFAHGPCMDSRQVAIELDEGDQRLLDHFIQFVLPTIFPILESNQHGSVASDLILPALQSNKGYLHCCLSIAAQHYKAMVTTESDEVDHDVMQQIDSDIMRHRYSTISSLCDALSRDEDHQQILEAALGLIFFQCCVGRFDDALPDIAWHQHFQAAISLVQKLDLPHRVSDEHQPLSQTPFNMTLTSWIDILSATMLGKAPTFAHTYREKHLSRVNHSLGLRELMGCEDRVMYLISEIACLEALKRDGMNDMMLCQHVHVLGEQIGYTEMGETGPKTPFNAHGTLSPKQLAKNMTQAFRLTARIYLCSLVPGFSPSQPSCIDLVERLTTVLQHIPSGPGGFDRSLVWVYLLGGSMSSVGSSFRTLFEDRVSQLGEQADYGSFGRVAHLLREVWVRNDELVCSPRMAADAAAGIKPEDPVQQGQQYVHWRDVMQMKGWEFLLI